MSLYEKCINTLASHIREDLESAIKGGDHWCKEMVTLILVDDDSESTILPKDHPVVLLNLTFKYGKDVADYAKKRFNDNTDKESRIKNLYDSWLNIEVNDGFVSLPHYCEVVMTLALQAKMHNLKNPNVAKDFTWYIKELTEVKPKDIIAECEIDVNLLPEHNLKFLKAYRQLNK